MKETRPLSMRFVGGKWLLLVAVVGWVGCSFDAGNLSTAAKQDANLSADVSVGKPDAAASGGDTLDSADVPDDRVVIENDADALEFGTAPDAPVLPSSNDAESRLADPGDDDSGVAIDLAQAMDVAVEANPGARGDVADAGDAAADIPGADDAPADVFVGNDLALDGSPADRGDDVKDSALGADAETGSDGSPAPSCGGSGQVCCAGNVCSNSGCCASGLCVVSGSTCPSPFVGTCTNGACGTCGGASEACCTNSSCTAANTICQTGPTMCTACGGSGAPCCPGNLCLDGGCCIAPAGGVETATCKVAGTTCSATISGTCSAGACGTCGGLGDPCCPNNRCTTPNTLCQTAPGSGGQASCVACGGAGQPCCANTFSSGAATCSAGFNCQTAGGLGGQSSCVACGGPGQPCCGSAAGGAGTCLSGSICQQAVGTVTYACASCGGPGQVCCAGNTCTTGTCRFGSCS